MLGVIIALFLPAPVLASVGIAPYSFLLSNMAISFFLIPLTLIVETLLVRNVLDLKLTKAFTITLVANIFSGLLGIVFVIYYSVAYSQARITTPFNLITEFIVAATGVALFFFGSLLIEAYSSHRLWHLPFRATLQAFFIGNIITHLVPIIIFFMRAS